MVTPAALADAVLSAVRSAVATGAFTVDVPTELTLESPKNPDHGDFATSIALRLAKPAGQPPRAIAEAIAAELKAADGVGSVEVAGPGFINIRLAADALGATATAILAAGSAYGTGETFAGQKINLEFVSANPTGPLHIGGVRWAAVGDSLARILTASGAEVTREYYFNDHGKQIDRFAGSLLAAARGEPTPEDGYGGYYIAEIASRVIEAVPDALSRADPQEIFRHEGVELMFAEIKQSLADFGVKFDVWTHEDSLHSSGRVGQALERLTAAGQMYEEDGATWLRTSEHGDDKDRVVIKSDGEPAYVAGDIAYYLDKRERGADRVIILLGADHSGYVGRLKAIAACFGDDPAKTMHPLIGQLVNLVKDGQPVRMSKRAGTLVNIDDLVDTVGVDAARYSLARSSLNSTIDLDLDLLARQASENPVFYVQYAGVRAASVLRNAAEMGIEPPIDIDVSLLTHPREIELLKALGQFPAIVASAAELEEPHRVARYLEESVAKNAQRFWDECQVLPKGDEDITSTTHARLLLWRATRVVLENGLRLLGVSAPERM